MLPIPVTRLLVLLLLLCLPASAAEFFSDGTSSDTQVKINSASDGDTVWIGTAASTNTWGSGGVSISGKGIHLRGFGAGRVVALSDTSITVGTGTKVFTISKTIVAGAISNGQTLTITRTGSQNGSHTGGSPQIVMTGTVTSLSGSTLTMDITSTTGSGTQGVWMIATQSSTKIINDLSSGVLVALTEDTTHNVEVSGIFFAEGTGSADSIDIARTSSGQPVLIHDNYIQTDGAGNGMDPNANRGVVWNTSFVALQFSMAMLAIHMKIEGLTDSWTTTYPWGADDDGTGKFYVEDCDFHAYLNATDCDDNSRASFRHCIFNNSGFGSHGADTSNYGNRAFELCDNEWIFNGPNGGTMNLNWWLLVRGGTFIVKDCVLPNISSQDYGNKTEIHLNAWNLTENKGPNPCWSANSMTIHYPLPRQCGMGRVTGAAGNDSITYIGDSEPIYIWDTTGSYVIGVSNGGFGECTSPDSANDYIIEDRDYFNGEAKPGYTEFEYPHPLRDETPPEQTVFYVDFANGDDADVGDEANPWKFAPGMRGWTGSQTLTNGDTVYFSSTNRWPVSHTNGSGILLEAGVAYYGNVWPVVSNRCGAELYATNWVAAGLARFKFDHPTDQTIFEGFRLNGQTTNACNGIEANHSFWTTNMSGAMKIIRKNDVHDLGGNGGTNAFTYGIIISDQSSDASGWVANVLIEDCRVVHPSRDAIVLYPGNNGMVSNVTIRNCFVGGAANDASYSEGHGFVMKGDVRNSVIEFGSTSNINSCGVFINGPESGGGSGPTGGIVRHMLLSTDNDDGAIRYFGTGTKSVDIYGCIVLANSSGGGLRYDGNSGTLTSRIYNNLFYLARVDIANPTSTGTLVFTNNIIVTTGEICLTDSGSDISGHNSNTYYRTDGGTLVSSGGMTYTSGTLSSYESSALSSDPLLKNTGNLPTVFSGTYGSTLAPNNDGLSLQQTSPSVDTGVDLGSSFNSTIASTTRSGSWDRGAYETTAAAGGASGSGKGRGQKGSGGRGRFK